MGTGFLPSGITKLAESITVFLEYQSYIKLEEMGVPLHSPKTNVKCSWQRRWKYVAIAIVYIPLLSIDPDQGPSTDLLSTSPKASLGKCKVF